MVGFDKTITIYNQRPDGKKTLWPKTVIGSTSWAGCQKVKTGEGFSSNDGYSVRTLQEAMPEGFMDKDEYKALSDIKGHWTAQNGDVVMLGIGPDVVDGITEITKRFTCFTVTAVHTDDLNRPLLPHLRLEGK